MTYGGVSTMEQEVIVRIDILTGHAHICSTCPHWSRKLERRYGAPTRVTEREGKITSAFWTIPASLVTLRKGDRKSSMSPEQRQAAKKHLDQVRHSRSKPSS